MGILLLLALSVWSAPSVAQTDDPNRAHPAPGTKIVRFGQLDEGIYRGSTPKKDADFRFLQSLGVKYILDLTYHPLLTKLQKRRAKRYGIVLIPVIMNASPIAPSQKHVNQALMILRDRRFHPIYLQCDYGRDRTGVIAGLYLIYFKGMSPEEAWQDMKHYGFKEYWYLRGLKAYFRKHSQRRPAFADPAQ